ncbi:hypothetical protein CYMTET_47613 [Cymbomonas tetramitiformis]|uniref:Uncharacterized protein n=1 Tax=Cymbomonas tetramitiformis TaxID=36881 RepID=A0AAE0EWF8_9CHLO|nr:hypothetical protein CYMTET_47613 [Cymbomonas tetramitiformis]
MSAANTRARRRLLLDSDIDASIRMLPAVRDSPTPSTPPVPVPAAPHANDSDGILRARRLFEENVAKVSAIDAKGGHRQWAKAVRELSLGGKDQYFEAAKDSEKPSKIVVVLKHEFSSAGLDLSSFDFDDLTKAVIPKVNELLHFKRSISNFDTPLTRVDPRPLLAREQRLVRDNRSEDWTPTESSRKYKLHERLDPAFYVAAELGVAAGPSVAGAAYSGMDERVLEVLGQLTTRLEKIEAAIKMQKAGGAASLPRNRRGKGLDGFRAGSSPTPPVGFDKDNRRALPLCHRCGMEGEGKKCHGYKECPYGGKSATGGSAAYCMPVAADDGSEAFTAAVAEYGAPAVLAGGESDGIDVSAYGFAVSDSGSGVLSELESLTGQVRAMEENVGVHISQFSLAEDEDVREHHAPVGAPSANAVASDVPRQVVPHGGGASAGGALATGGYMAQFRMLTEEFPGGVDLVPQVIGCGAPPPGLRPNFVMLACFLGLLGIGFAGAAGIGGASGSGMPAADAQPTAVPAPPDYWRPEGYYTADHNPRGWTWYPGPSYPQVVVPFPGPWRDGVPPSPPYSPPSPEHEPEEVEQPALNGDRQSARDGLYINDGYGMDLTAPLHRAGNNNIADIFTQPLPPRAIFYENPSYYGLELQSETSGSDSGYGSAMDAVD